MRDDIYSTELEYSVGNENKLVTDTFGANIFAEANRSQLEKLYKMGQEDFLDKYEKALGDSATTV